MTRIRDYGTIKLKESPHALMEPADFGFVEWTRGFWASRFERTRDVTLPWLRQLAEDADPSRHVVDNFRIAAGEHEADTAALCPWSDAWMYKWLESAATVFGVTHAPDLGETMDRFAEIVARAQEPDGYLATQVQLHGSRHRFENPATHEVYVMGHLLSAAALHSRITGKDTLMSTARKVADHLFEMYKGHNPRMAHFPFNPSVIMGAVELFRATREQRYLELANIVIDMRGMFPVGVVREGGPLHPGHGDQCQDRVPLREETEVVGHNVFWSYLFAGATDVYMETGDERLLGALERLFDDFTQTKMYITGGASALFRGFSWREGRPADAVHEAVGEPYELPHGFAYNETCGQYGAFLWGWRMLHATGNARYADLMELEMYNGWLPGIDVEGRRFFYTNPLRWNGESQRVHGNNSQGRHLPGKVPGSTGGHRICCPTNVLRGLASMHGYLYSRSESELWIHHYAGSVYDDGSVRVRLNTDYPWDGLVSAEIERVPRGDLGLRLRIPQWCTDASVVVNGESGPVCRAGDYVVLKRTWKAGDRIELSLPMTPRLVVANHRVEEARGQVAVMRGPMLYCLESPDFADEASVFDIVLDDEAKLTPEHREEFLGGLTVLRGNATVVASITEDLYRTLEAVPSRQVEVTLIPYYAWANRGVSQMTVWIPLNRSTK